MKKLVGCKWVTVKVNLDGFVAKLKSRFVTKGMVKLLEWIIQTLSLGFWNLFQSSCSFV